MKAKVMFVLGLLICSYALAGSISAEPEDFEVLWLITLPRDIYFVGETVTFTLTAYASIDPTLKLPDQMATVTIRNESSVEVFSAWINTNVNGSASVQWESGLEASTGNYTVILKDLNGKTVTKNFMVLYNEETYWKTRVELLEKEIDKMYEHLNYLFAANKYLNRKVGWLDQQFKLLWVMGFVAVMCGVYVAMHEFAMSGRTTSTGIMSYPGKIAEILGFRRKPIVELDHEIVANLRVPREKRVPIYGHTHYCLICDGKKQQPMTEGQLRDHMWAKHDRLHMKKASIVAKWRERVNENAVKAEKKAKEEANPQFASVEQYQMEWKEQQTKEHFQARLELIKRQLRKKTITPAEAKRMISQLKEDLHSANLTKPVPTEALKQTTSAKPVVQRKVRVEKYSSGIPKAPEKSPAKISDSKNAIDELFDKLNNEKVN